MECKIKDRHKLISDYLMGELPDDDAKIFEEHYFQCETCFKELKIVEDAINIIAKEGITIFEPEAHQPLAEEGGKSSENKYSKNFIPKLIFPDLSPPKRWGIAFAAITVMVLALFLTLLNDQEVLNDKVITKNKETLPENQENPLAADTISEKDNSPFNNDFAELTGPAFKPVPYLEEWITENVRSVNNNIDTILSPGIGEKFQEKVIIFNWRMVEKENVSLKILTNLEEEIFTSNLDKNQLSNYTVQATPEIFKKAGLYYWRIEDENEVLFTGKFYFLK
jgi:hypothetical protein